MRIHHQESATFKQLSSSNSGERYSQSALLSESLALNSLHVSHEKLAPGRRSSAPHSHAQVDEMIFVLKGVLTAFEGSAHAALKAGDCASFAAGSEHLHFLENQSTEEAEFLLIRKAAEENVRFK